MMPWWGWVLAGVGLFISSQVVPVVVTLFNMWWDNHKHNARLHWFRGR